MKKKVLVLAAFLLTSAAFCTPKSSSTSGKEFYIQTQTGAVYGSMEKFLYSSALTDRAVSRLVWEMKPLWYFGLLGGTKLGNFEAQIEFNGALSLRSGRMFDYDFTTDGTLTTYSVHEETAVHSAQTSIGLNYALFRTKNVDLKTAVEVFYSYNSFTARNGYGWYGMNLPEDDPGNCFYEPGRLYGIDYSRHSFYTFAGIAAELRSGPHWGFTFELMMSPFAYISGLDHHLNASEGTHYMEVQYALFKAMKSSFGIYVNFGTMRASLTCSGLVQSLQKGTLYHDYWSENLSRSDQPCASKNSTANICLSLRKYF